MTGIGTLGRWAFAVCVAGWLWPTQSAAAPGQAVRLGGVDAQGPASRAVTALHHNPAMLAALRGTAVQAGLSGGIDHLRVRRYGIDPDSGMPIGSLIDPVTAVNPRFGFFAGASFYFDPVALSVGLYDLSSQFRLTAPDALRFHLAPDPDPGCLRPEKGECPPNGGSVSYRQDLTLALAWNLGQVKLGAAVHFPRVRERFAFDNDTELTPSPEGVVTAQCDFKEDPLCAERVGFKGWTHWIPSGNAPPGFDAALTFGAAVELKRETITLGARYRTFPLRRSGEVVLGGVALVCRPDVDTDVAQDAEDAVPPCSLAQPVDATLRQRLPQELAIGGSFVLGRARLWKIDTNLYWMDLCPGGVSAASCPKRQEGAQTLRLIGLDRNSFVLPEFQRYRGLQDLYGVDVYGSYKIRSSVAVLFGGNMSSPSVRRSAQTAAGGEGWRVGASFGARIRMRQTNVLLTPGYGIDVLLPRNVRPSDAGFTPRSATEFAAAGRDLNSSGAEAVLQGRARPTNAGRYFGMLHTFSLAVSWGESAGVLE